MFASLTFSLSLIMNFLSNRRRTWPAGSPLWLVVALLSIAPAARAQHYGWPWITTGGGSQGSDEFERVTTDAAGHVVVAGRFRKTATFGTTTLTATGNQDDIVVAKLTPAGAFEWVARASGPDDDMALGVAVGRTGLVYIAGFAGAATTFGSTVLPASSPTVSSGFVACLDGATGDWRWAMRLPANCAAKAMVLDASDNLYVGGDFFDTATFGTTQLTAQGLYMYDPFVAKLVTAGTPRWQWAASMRGDNTHDRLTALALDAGGNVYAAGEFQNPALQAGTQTLPLAGLQDAFVARLSATGQWRWAVPLGGPAEELVTGLTATPTGLVVCGGFRGVNATQNNTRIGTYTLANGGPATTYDGYAAKLNLAAGAVQWATRFGGSKNDLFRTLTGMPSGDVLVTGFYDSPVVALGDSTCTNTSYNALADSFVARLSANGQQWEVLSLTTGQNCEFTLGLTVAPTGTGYVVGCFASVPTPATIGPFTVTSTGYFDAFVTRLDPLTVTGLPAAAGSGGLQVWPNPARQVVGVRGAGSAALELLDVLGRVVLTAPAGAEALPLAGVPAGLYTVRAGAVRQRLVVE